MSDGLEPAAHSFAEKPGTEQPAPQAQPRNVRGQFEERPLAPEPIFALREVEGDPLTGDTRDGGDFESLRAHEREIADGRVWERNDSQESARPRRASTQENGTGGQRRLSGSGSEHDNAAADSQHPGTEIEPEDFWAIAAEGADTDGGNRAQAAEGERSDATGPRERDAESEGSGTERYEITVDGETHQVTLQEALRGYTRQATFHKRLQALSQQQQELSNNDMQVRALYAQWQQDRRNYEEDVAAMLPQEPNWDQEFARDPAGAHAQQKIFQTIYSKLAASQQTRAQREAAMAAENDRRVQKYAVDGFSKFVMDNIKAIPDEPTLQKNLQSMRRTAAALGFSEYEVATVYDPRMLNCLLKASRYDRMMAARPRAVIPGKGRTLPPGAATPFGNAPRKGLDEALRRQANSGRLEDTADVMRRLL